MPGIIIKSYMNKKLSMDGDHLMKSLDELIAEAKLAKKQGAGKGQRNGAGQVQDSSYQQPRQSHFQKKGIQKNKGYLHDD